MLRQMLMVHPRLWRVARHSGRRLFKKDERELALLRNLVPGDQLAIDVGANTGVYCEELVRFANSVVAIEANPTLAAHLEWMFEGKIRVIAAAASNVAGSVTLRIPDDPRLGGLASVAADNFMAAGHSVTVPAITLDSLRLENVGFIKIDVEGHEASVLEGARGLLMSNRPNILVEAEERHTPGAVAKVCSILAEAKYVGFMLRAGVLRSVSEFDPARDQCLDGISIAELNQGRVPPSYVNNFIFLPL
jgi:FkbM family methyltransferase